MNQNQCFDTVLKYKVASSVMIGGCIEKTVHIAVCLLLVTNSIMYTNPIDTRTVLNIP